MTKVKFYFDQEKDRLNICNKINHPAKFGTFKVEEKLRKICFGRKLKDCRSDLINYLKPLYSSEKISAYLKSIEIGWRPIEKEFFKRADNLFGKKLGVDVKAFLTTINICPYDPDEHWFMISFAYPIPLTLMTCGHEIMHLYFHDFYWKAIEKEIGKSKTEDLKEALTVLLNLEFRGLGFAEDEGYSEHKALRAFITKEWKIDRDFTTLMQKCISYLKQ